MKKNVMICLAVLCHISTNAQTILDQVSLTTQLNSGVSNMQISANNYTSVANSVPVNFRLMIGPNLRHNYKKLSIQLGFETISYVNPFIFEHYDQFSGERRLYQSQKDKYFGWLLNVNLGKSLYAKVSMGNTSSKKDIKLADGILYHSDNLEKAKTMCYALGFKICLLKPKNAGRLYLAFEGTYSSYSYPAKFYPVSDDFTANNIYIYTWGVNTGLVYNYKKTHD
jgi:hypothetical protein